MPSLATLASRLALFNSARRACSAAMICERVSFAVIYFLNVSLLNSLYYIQK